MTVTNTVKTALSNPSDIHNLIACIAQETEFTNVHLMYGSLELMQFEQELVATHGNNATQLLKDIVKQLSPAYDLILIDTPPDLRLYTQNALACATDYIVPVASESIYDLYGSAQLQKHLSGLKRSNIGLNFLGVLFIRHNPATHMGQQIPKDAKEIFGKVLNTTICQATAINKSAYLKKALSDMGSDYGYRYRYRELAFEIAPSLGMTDLNVATYKANK